MPGMPAVGDIAPDFTATATDGSTISLRGLAGRMVVLYFYPKDDTPGCTREACSFRDRHAELTAAGITVLGVSPDDVDSHRKFTAKFSLGFPLLADTDHKIAEAYGAWGERSMYGRKFMGVIRSTFLIDGTGRIAASWPKVKPDDHADEVLAAAGTTKGKTSAPPPAAPAKAKPKATTVAVATTTPESPTTKKAKPAAASAPGKKAAKRSK